MSSETPPAHDSPETPDWPQLVNQWLHEPAIRWTLLAAVIGTLAALVLLTAIGGPLALAVIFGPLGGKGGYALIHHIRSRHDDPNDT